MWLGSTSRPSNLSLDVRYGSLPIIAPTSLFKNSSAPHVSSAAAGELVKVGWLLLTTHPCRTPVCGLSIAGGGKGYSSTTVRSSLASVILVAGWGVCGGVKGFCRPWLVFGLMEAGG